MQILWGSALSMAQCSDSLVGFGALELARVWADGEWWRVVTTGLLHGSWLHLILNVWSLWTVGEWAERAWGRWRFLLLFAASSVGGCAASLAWAEAPMVVGASAGIIGVAGALLVLRVFGSEEMRGRVLPISARVLGICLAVLVLIGFLVPMIAQAGHLGGLVVGSVLGLAWSERGPAAQRFALGGLAVGMVAGFVYGGDRAQWRPKYDELMGYRLLEQGQSDEAARHLDRALERRPADADLANGVAYALAEADVELERAETLVRRALEDDPKNPDYLDTLGWTLCRLGRVDEGRAELRRAEEASSESIPEIVDHLERCAAPR